MNHEINKVASSCLAHKNTKTLIIPVWEQYGVRPELLLGLYNKMEIGEFTQFQSPEIELRAAADSFCANLTVQFNRTSGLWWRFADIWGSYSSMSIAANQEQWTMDDQENWLVQLCFCYRIQSFLTVNTIKLRNCSYCLLTCPVLFPNSSWHHLLSKITQHCLQSFYVIIMTRNIIIIWGRDFPMIENQQDLHFLLLKIIDCLCKAQSHSL